MWLLPLALLASPSAWAVPRPPGPVAPPKAETAPEDLPELSPPRAPEAAAPTPELVPAPVPPGRRVDAPDAGSTAWAWAAIAGVGGLIAVGLAARRASS